MQFKVSQRLEYPKRNDKRSMIPGIIEFRRKNNFCNETSLYFQLRKRAKCAVDYQHNILMHMNKPNESSFGIYVAPLILDKNQYYDSLVSSIPWWKRIICLSTPVHKFATLKIYNSISDTFLELSQVPILKNHISIVPHERVAHNKHFYSYSQIGGDVCWHSSGKVLNYGISRLSDFFYGLYLKYSDQSKERFNVQSHIKFMKNLMEEENYNFQNQDQNQIFKEFGKYMYTKYQIKQFLLCSEKNE